MAKPHNRKGDLVRKHLLAAFARNDSAKFLDVCQHNQSTILECFNSWKVVPETIRNDPAATGQYVQVLMIIADIFRSIGHPELFESLVGKNNPLSRWQNQLATAYKLSDAGEFEKSTSILLGLLGDMEGASGSAVDDWHPKILGLLGTNAFHVGNFGTARGYIERAWDECKRIGDRNGVRIYRENLQLIRAVELRTKGSEIGTGIMAKIVKAQDLSDTQRYQRSNKILYELLDNLTQLVQEERQLGEDYRGKIYGLIGTNYFKLHDIEQAHKFTQMALQECEHTGDDYGVMIYAANLDGISRK